MKIEELIKAYNKAENKELAIKRIAREANITRGGVVKFLRQYGIQIPKGIVIVEEWEEEGYVEEEKSEEKEGEEEMTTAISIQRFFEERWEDKKGIERAIILHKYIEEKWNLNSFGIYIFCLEYIIKHSGTKGLTKDLDRIISGKPFNAKTKEINITDILLDSVEKMLIELTEPEPETKPKKVIDEKPLLVRFFEAYKMLENPVKYKIDKWREKEARKKELNREALEVIREALG